MSEIALDDIFDRGAFDLQRILSVEPDFLHHRHEHDHEGEIESLSLIADRPVDPDNFQMWMGALRNSAGRTSSAEGHAGGRWRAATLLSTGHAHDDEFRLGHALEAGESAQASSCSSAAISTPSIWSAASTTA